MQMLEGAGGAYDPDVLDVDTVNAALELYARHTRQTAHASLVVEANRRAVMTHKWF